MKLRAVGFALAMTAALAVAAGSGIVRARAVPRPEIPATPAQTLVRRLGGQVGSDTFTGRGAKPQEVKRLLEFAARRGSARGDAFWMLLQLRDTPYRAEILGLAARAGAESDEEAAFAAIDLLQSWGDPRWRPLAQAQASRPGEWGATFRTLFDE